MDRQTLPDWVHCYNEAGIVGLASRKPPGASPKLTQAQMAELRKWVIAGPNRKIHKSSIGNKCVSTPMKLPAQTKA